jgi:hypothetical protein
VNRSLKQKLLAGAAAALILAGATMAAVTAAQSSGPHRAKGGPLVSAAGYLGVSVAQLQSELKSGKSLAEIANATSGKSASGLIDALVSVDRTRLAAAAASLPKRVAAQVAAPGGPGGAITPARYLGLSPAQLHSELHSGRSMAQIADATPGKSAAGLVATIVTARKATLKAWVAAGVITQAQADTRAANMTKRVTAVVNRVLPRG